jgi:hypothetical protein
VLRARSFRTLSYTFSLSSLLRSVILKSPFLAIRFSQFV